MKHRVAILIPHLGLGGVERVMQNLVLALRGQGSEADLLTLKDLAPSRPLLHVSTTALRLTHHLRKEKYTALVSAKEQANVIASMTRRVLGSSVTTLLTRHVPLRDVGRDSRWVVPHLYRRMYRPADGFIGVSDEIASALRQAVGPKRAPRVHSLPNAVIGPDFTRKSQASISHPWLSDARPLLVTVGRLAPQKGLPLLIDALALIPKAQRPRWVVIGDGPDRAELASRLSQKGLEHDACFLGSLDNPYPWIARADLLALPSVYEGLPTVLIEALALGTRCVATDCPTGPAQIARHGGTLALASSRDPKVFADTLQETLTSPPSASPFDPTPFSFEHAAQGYLNLL